MLMLPFLICSCVLLYLKRDLMSKCPCSIYYTGGKDGNIDYSTYVPRPDLDQALQEYFDTQSEPCVNLLIGPPKSGKKALVCGNIKNYSIFNRTSWIITFKFSINIIFIVYERCITYKFHTIIKPFCSNMYKS